MLLKSLFTTFLASSPLLKAGLTTNEDYIAAMTGAAVGASLEFLSNSVAFGYKYRC